MKKIFLIIIVISISWEKISSQNSVTTVEKIESINKKDGTVVITEFFDRKGNKTKIINHSKTYGDTETTFIYDTTTNDLIIEKKYDVKKLLKETRSYEYEYELNKIKQKLTFEQKSGKEKRFIIEDLFNYNNEGLLINKKHRTVYGNYEYKYSYHKNKKLKEEMILSANETEKVIISYDSNGKRIEERIYRKKTANNDFKLELTNYWYYNSDGNEVTKDGTPIKGNSPFTKKYTHFK